MRSGVRATYFKYELDQVDDGVSYSFAGPAFGIRGYDNLFLLHYYPTNKIVLREVEDGSIGYTSGGPDGLGVEWRWRGLAPVDMGDRPRRIVPEVCPSSAWVSIIGFRVQGSGFSSRGHHDPVRPAGWGRPGR